MGIASTFGYERVLGSRFRADRFDHPRHYVLTCPTSSSVGYTVGSIPHNTEPQSRRTGHERV